MPGFLNWFVIVPLLTAFAIVLTPASRPHVVRWLAAAGTFILLVMSCVLTWKYWVIATSAGAGTHDATTQLEFVTKLPWFESLGITYFLGVDGISVSMVLLTGIIIFTAVLASWHMQERIKEFFVFLLVLVAGVFGVFVAFDLFLFLIFYELAVLPMYLLIGVWGTGKRTYSAMKLTLMLLLGSAGIIVGFLALYHGSGLQTFDLIRLGSVEYPESFQRWVFPCLFIGFGVLGALYPFHTWSPDGHASAPTAVSMLHAGVLMKLGGYGILRVGLYLLPEGAQHWAMFFMILCTINIIYGAFGAIQQRDLKYFTAYSSVSHCGFVLFGLVTLNTIGVKGAVIQMFSHGIMTGLFFALIGMVYGRAHTRMIPEMGGLARRMPWLATCFYIAGLASLGLPGLSGFIAESHVFIGGFFGNAFHDITTTRVLTVIATASIVVTAVYVLRGLAAVFQGPLTNKKFESLTDAVLPERLSTGILVATLALLGMLPWLFNQLIEGSVVTIVDRLTGPGGLAGF